VAEVLSRLGAEHVMVVHSDDGLDEISSAAPTHVAEARDGAVRSLTVTPEDAGLETSTLDGLDADTAADSLRLVRAALSGEPSDLADRARRLVALNAGAALYVAGLHDTVSDGVRQAMALMEAGTPWKKVEALAELSSSMP
jgi:anthranilate phosphoribosyltransferase